MPVLVEVPVHVVNGDIMSNVGVLGIPSANMKMGTPQYIIDKPM